MLIRKNIPAGTSLRLIPRQLYERRMGVGLAFRPTESADLRSSLSDTLPFYHAPDCTSAFRNLSLPARLDQEENSLGTLIAIWNTPSSVERQPNFTGPGAFGNGGPPSAVPVQILLDIIHVRSEFVK